ncbi:TPA: NupC/NupG family nucleoside CNT transporter [Candidatus Dependentiae bacterium]|nr:MAG: Nucleoside transporter, NupC family [candidate division TM6 bacterium GW2011_GWF2_43_87]HBL98807.1 NupC/NupG family nucleoside CNT transporter [Candidatus Dependentiae bacterium]
MFFDYFVEYNRYLNVLGIAVVLAVAYVFSLNRKRINHRLVISAFLMLFAVGALVLKTLPGQWVVERIADGVGHIYRAGDAGIKFLFGGLSSSDGAWGPLFAIQVLPLIIFFGAFMALLFHYGVVQWVVSILAKIFRPLFGTSGAETLCTVANTFLGQTEAPLLIRNYLETMTRSEIFLVMVAGMGTMSGSIIAIYAKMGVPVVHMLCASVMAVPSTILIAKIMVPETEQPETASGAKAEMEVRSHNMLEAIAIGALDGLTLVLNIAAILLAFIALIFVLNVVLESGCLYANRVLSWMGSEWLMPTLSLQYIFGWVFMPISWMMGTGPEMARVAEIIGVKLSVNELIAYQDMLSAHLSTRSTMLLTYALCGFANFSSIGLQIGGIGALAPSRRSLLSAFGFRALLGGTLANILSTMVAGLLV